MNCRYCGKECKNNNSLSQHEIRCKKNPNKIPSSFIKYNEEVKLGIRKKKYTNQFTKAEILGLPKPVVSEETKEKQKTWLGKKFPESGKEKIRNTINSHIINNEWHTNYGKKYYYNDICFDSSWEVDFVKFLDKNNIKWSRPNKSFEYFYENSIHNYYPDIYLIDYNIYIEIKAIPTLKDFEKWKQFEYDLDIYDSLDLHNLGLDIPIDNRNLIPEEFRNKHINLGLS